MMSDKKKYLKDLEKELEDLPLRDRFLQEISDHLEDSDEDNIHPLTYQTMYQKIGTPKEIKNNYYSILKPLRIFYFGAEGLFYGFLLLPFGLTYFLFSGFLMTGSFLGILGLILFCALWFIGFSLAFKHWKKITQETGYPLWSWILLILLPTSIALGTQLFTLLSCCSIGNSLKDIVSIGVVFFLIVMSLILASYLAWKNLMVTTKQVSGSWKKRIAFSLFLYLLIYGILRIGISYGIFSHILFTGINPFITALFMPLIFLEFMALTIQNSLFSTQELVHGIWTINFLGLILFFLIAQAMVPLIKKRKPSWLRIGVAWLALSLFVVNPNSYAPQLEWHKKIIPISENIEKEQHGFLYGLMKYANQNEGRMYRYHVVWQNNQFELEQNSGVVFLVDPVTVEKNFYAQMLSSAETVSKPSDKTPNWPEELGCMGEPGQVFGSFISCHHLTWKGSPLFSADYTSTISDIAVSEDRKWLMLIVTMGAYNPEYAYLVEL